MTVTFIDKVENVKFLFNENGWIETSLNTQTNQHEADIIIVAANRYGFEELSYLENEPRISSYRGTD